MSMTPRPVFEDELDPQTHFILGNFTLVVHLSHSPNNISVAFTLKDDIEKGLMTKPEAKAFMFKLYEMIKQATEMKGPFSFHANTASGTHARFYSIPAHNIDYIELISLDD